MMPSQGGEASPGDERDEDETRRTHTPRQKHTRDLAKKVAEEEKRAQQCRALLIDAERGRKSGSRTKAVVGPVKISQAIGDEDQWQ